MLWRCLTIVSLFALAVLGGCRNVPGDERDALRDEFDTSRTEGREEMRAKLRRILAGDAQNPPDGDPHLRATAAQGLGELGDPRDAKLLRDRLLGVLRDENVQVRIECAIALGKLNFTARGDDRRVDTIRDLRDRLAFDRDADNRPRESQFMVRNAMLNSLIAIGGRDAAVAIYDVATRIHGDLSNIESSLFTSATDRGVLDQCFVGLGTLTSTTASEAAANRVETDSINDHLDWWAGRIADMPDN